MKIAAMAFLCGRQNATTCTALHSLPDSPVQLSRNSDVLAQGLMSGAPDCSLLEQRGITGLERAIERFKENVAAREFMPSHFGASLTSGNEIGLSNCFGEVMQGFPVYSPPSFQSLVLPSHPHAQTQLPHDTSVIPMSCMDASKAHLSSLTVTMHSCPVESSEPLTPHPQFSPTHAGGFEFSWKASFISSSHNPPPPLPRCNPNVLSPECKPPKSIFTRNSTSGTHKKVEWLPQLQNAQGPFSVEPISAPLMCMEQLEPYITHDDVSAHRPLNNGNSHHSSKELAAMEAQLVFDQANTSTMQPFQMPMYNHSTCNENDGEHSPADDLLVSLSSSNSTTGQNIQAISSVEDSFSKYSDIPVDSTDVIHHDHFHDSEQRGYLASNTSTGRMSMDSRITGREQGLISANTSLAPPPVFGEVFPNSAVNFAPTGPHYMFLPVVPPMAQMCFPPRHGDFSPMAGELCQSMLPHSNGLRRKAAHRSRKKRTHGEPMEEGIHQGMKLWQFLLEILVENKHPTIIRWTSKQEGMFKVIDSEGLAKLWGEHKNRPEMNYDKMSRAMRYYYNKNLLDKVPRRLYYQFRYYSKWWERLQSVDANFKMNRLPEAPPIQSLSKLACQQENRSEEPSFKGSNSDQQFCANK